MSVYSQDEKTVTLVVSGQGKTQDEAKQNALRSAIEQAFGAFISSKTEILNDKLVQDEIVSVANGNIQKFDVISEVQIPEAGYAATLKATVSITKLTSFCESKGMGVDFNGSLFALNVNQQILNEKNEGRAIQYLLVALKKIIESSLDFNIKAGDPASNSSDNALWAVPLTISFSINNNFSLFKNHLVNSLRGIAMPANEVKNYKALGKQAYSLKINREQFYFRKEESVKTILTELNFYFAKCVLESGIESNVSSSPISSFIVLDMRGKTRGEINMASSFNPVNFKTDSNNYDYMMNIENIFELVKYFKWTERGFNYNSVDLKSPKGYSGGYYFMREVNYNISEGDRLVVIKVKANYSFDDLKKINRFSIARYIGK